MQSCRGPSQAGQWVDTLCLLCALHVVPPSALAVVAYLILQLVSSGEVAAISYQCLCYHSALPQHDSSTGG